MTELRDQQGIRFALVEPGAASDALSLIERGEANGLQITSFLSSDDWLNLQNFSSSSLKGLIVLNQERENVESFVRKNRFLSMISHDITDILLDGTQLTYVSQYSGPDSNQISIDLSILRYLYADPLMVSGFIFRNINKLVSLEEMRIGNSDHFDCSITLSSVLHTLDFYKIGQLCAIEDIFLLKSVKSISINKCKLASLLSDKVIENKSVECLFLCDFSYIDNIDFIYKLPSLKKISFYNSKIEDLNLDAVFAHPNVSFFSSPCPLTLRGKMKNLQKELSRRRG